MTQDYVPMLVRSLCRAFPDDPALQRELLDAKRVDDVVAALSESADCAYQLRIAAQSAPSGPGDVALANARNAADARRTAIWVIVAGGIDETGPVDDAPAAAAARPSLRVVSTGQ